MFKKIEEGLKLKLEQNENKCKEEAKRLTAIVAKLEVEPESVFFPYSLRWRTKSGLILTVDVRSHSTGIRIYTEQYQGVLSANFRNVSDAIQLCHEWMKR